MIKLIIVILLSLTRAITYAIPKEWKPSWYTYTRT